MRYTLLFMVFIGACVPTDVDDTPFDETTCEVTRRDVATGAITNQLVFSEFGLVSHAFQLAPGTRGLRINTYQNGRLVRGEAETWNRANESQTFGAWQMRMAVYESDTYFHEDLTFTYDAAGQLIQWDTDSVTSYADTRHVSKRRVVYTWNAKGQKIRTDQYSGNGLKPWLTNTYTHRSQDGRLENIHTVQDGHPRDLRFVYDKNGNLIRQAEDDFPGLRYDFDDHGRLVGRGGTRYFTRDADGLIVTSSLGTPVRYTYVDGRLATANYEDGSSYTQTYSPGCPSGFTHPLITPNSLYLEHYEGPPMHHTWSSY
jgi:YD repeat-containing protein